MNDGGYAVGLEARRHGRSGKVGHHMIEMRSLNLESAQRAVAAAVEAGRARNRKIALVVVDKFGDLLRARVWTVWRDGR